MTVFMISRDGAVAFEAERIEKSGETTRALVDAFGDEENPAPEEMIQSQMPVEPPNESSFREMLGDLLDFALAALEKNRAAQEEFSRKTGRLPDAVADEINTIAVGFFGDILLEETDEGFSVIEGYENYLG